MNTLEELKSFSKRFFLESGLIERGDSYHINSKFSVNSEVRFNRFIQKNIEYSKLDGINIVISEVHRSNGTKANTSIYVSVMSWKNNSGSVLHKEKISFKSSENKVKNQLNNVLSFYNNM